MAREARSVSFFLMGETQIISGKGEILARLSDRDGEGVITAEVALGEMRERRLDIRTGSGSPKCPLKNIACGRRNSRPVVNTTEPTHCPS
jgi:hypothetical protein